MGGQLREKVAQGVAWSMAEKIGSMLLAMAVRLVILRLLTPDILGFMSIPSAVATILLVVVDSGFSQSLIRHRAPSQSDYKSVFLFNMAVSLALYAALMALMPFAARWYDMPQIARIAPVFFLLLPLNIFSTYYFQALIKQRAAFVVSVSRGLVLSGILIYLLPAAFEPSAIWWTMPITELVVAIFVVNRMVTYTKQLPKGRSAEA